MGAPQGNRNNPNGRPPKSRSLTAALEAALAKPILLEGETASVKVRGHVLVAALVTELATTGVATLPGGKVLDASPKDWLETVKWLYSHIDGPPKQELELSGALGILKGYTTKDTSPDAWSDTPEE